MADPILWPYDVLPPAHPAFDINPRSTRGSANGLGASQNVVSSVGLWTATYTGVPLNTAQRIKCWRALEGILQGRSLPLLVPLRDKPDRMPLPAAANGRRSVFLPHSSSASFSDGSLYQQDTIVAELAASAALAATTVSIRMITDVLPEPGQHFSIGVRLYRIARLVSSVDDTVTVRIVPPLREAVASGERADFSNPVCKMRLATDTELSAGTLSANRFAVRDVSFVEDTL
jgi:hypothetical protein